LGRSSQGRVEWKFQTQTEKTVKRIIRRTKQLGQDVIESCQYIRERNPEAAARVFDAIEASIRGLVDTPGIGTVWNAQDPRLNGMRVATIKPFRNYLIFFRATDETIEVFRLVHGARDLGPVVDEIDFEFE
jgi:toxin ParE1/3/4